MAGRVALIGGGEFGSGCESMDGAILAATGAPHPSVVILPTAAAGENPRKAASNGIAYFSRLGAKASALMVLEASQANNAKLLKPLDLADVIYLTGGDPAYLLDTLAGSLLQVKLEEAIARGATLAGSSAGAMVMGSWMKFQGWRKALGIVPGIAVLPHHEGSDPVVTSRQLATSAPQGVIVLGIDSQSCCWVSFGSWPYCCKVLGQTE